MKMSKVKNGRRTKKKRKTRLHFRRGYRSFNAGKMKEIIIWLVEIIAVCVLAWMLVSLFGQRVSNAGDSMRPVLKNGDVVLIDRMVYNAKKPVRGDIIAFKPNGNENTHYSIKRVVGLPGETVQIKDGKVYINGEALKKDVYVSDIGFAGIAEEPVELGETEYFVLGDNCEGSDDSRLADVGNVTRSDIYGKVWFVTSFGGNFGFVK